MAGLLFDLSSLVELGSTRVLASRSQPTPEIVLLATGSAGSRAVIDIVNVAKRRIWPDLLLDAIVELAVHGGWMQTWRWRLALDDNRHA